MAGNDPSIVNLVFPFRRLTTFDSLSQFLPLQWGIGPVIVPFHTAQALALRKTY
jgi:hypothetical protein